MRKASRSADKTAKPAQDPRSSSFDPSFKRKWPGYLRTHRAFGKAFARMQAGCAAAHDAGFQLKKMLGKQLFRTQYQSFEEYLLVEWDISLTWASLLINFSRTYTRAEAMTSGLFTSHLLLLASSGLDDKTREGVQEMLKHFKPTKAIAAKALQAAREAKADDRSREEQRLAAEAVVREAQREKEEKEKERQGQETARKGEKWIQGPLKDLSPEDYQAAVDLKEASKKLYPSFKTWLRNLSQVNKKMQDSEVLFTEGKPVAIWEMLMGSYQQLPALMAEYLAHLPEDKRKEAMVQIEEMGLGKEAVLVAISERAARMEEERRGLEAVAEAVERAEAGGAEGPQPGFAPAGANANDSADKEGQDRSPDHEHAGPDIPGPVTPDRGSPLSGGPRRDADEVERVQGVRVAFVDHADPHRDRERPA